MLSIVLIIPSISEYIFLALSWMTIFVFPSHIPRKGCWGLSLTDDPFWKAVVAKDAEEPFELRGNVSRSAGQLAGRQELCSLKHRLSHVKPRSFSVPKARACVGWSRGSMDTVMFFRGTRVREPKPLSHPHCLTAGCSQRGTSGTASLWKPLWGTANRGGTVTNKAPPYLLLFWAGQWFTACSQPVLVDV